jgi:hypothetical protein
MLHGDRLLSANVRLPHAVLLISCDAKRRRYAAAEAEAGEPQRQPDFTQAELSPDKPDFFTYDFCIRRIQAARLMVQKPNARRISASTRGTVACQARRMVTLLCLARRPATSSERESLQDVFSTRFTGLELGPNFEPGASACSATTLSTGYSTAMGLGRGIACRSTRSTRGKMRESPLLLGHTRESILKRSYMYDL